jgi:hypothetical protein
VIKDTNDFTILFTQWMQMPASGSLLAYLKVAKASALDAAMRARSADVTVIRESLAKAAVLDSLIATISSGEFLK